jgi:hypothetical protein
MSSVWGVFWREILIATGAFQGMLLRYHVDPVDVLISVGGSLGKLGMGLITILDVLPFLFGAFKSFEHAWWPGVTAFGVAIWAGYVFPVNQRDAASLLLTAMIIGLIGVMWQDLRD